MKHPVNLTGASDSPLVLYEEVHRLQNQYLLYRQATCKTNTVDSDQYAYRFLNQFLHTEPMAHDLRSLLLAFHAYLRARTDISNGTKAFISERVYALCNWAVDELLLERNPLKRKEVYKRPSPKPQPLSLAEVKRILCAVDGSLWTAKRDRAMIITAVELGCRRGELIQMRVADVETGYSLVMQKGDRCHKMIITQLTYCAISEYINAYQTQTKHLLQPIDLLWRSWCHNPLTADQVRKRMRVLSKRTGVRLWIHRLRATSATLRLALGASTETVRAQLGHSTDRALRHYVDLADDQRQILLESSSPIKALDIQ